MCMYWEGTAIVLTTIMYMRVRAHIQVDGFGSGLEARRTLSMHFLVRHNHVNTSILVTVLYICQVVCGTVCTYTQQRHRLSAARSSNIQ